MKVLNLAELISPFTVEVEIVFFLEEFDINSFTKERIAKKISHCMCICKFPKILASSNIEQILSHFLQGKGKKDYAEELQLISKLM